MPIYGYLEGFMFGMELRSVCYAQYYYLKKDVFYEKFNTICSFSVKNSNKLSDIVR